MHRLSGGFVDWPGGHFFSWSGDQYSHSKCQVTGARAYHGAAAGDRGDTHLTSDVAGISPPRLCFVLCYSSASPLSDRVTTPALPSTVII
jgi:hypothetical protein